MFQSKCTITQFLLNDMFLCLRLKLFIIQPPPPPSWWKFVNWVTFLHYIMILMVSPSHTIENWFSALNPFTKGWHRLAFVYFCVQMCTFFIVSLHACVWICVCGMIPGNYDLYLLPWRQANFRDIWRIFNNIFNRINYLLHTLLHTL